MKFAAFALMLAMSAAARAQQVAITFDDLPLHSSTPPGETQLDVAKSLLATFQKEHLPPVYGMVNAVRLESQPGLIEVLKAWRAADEPLASHTYSHMDLNKHTAAEFEADIVKDEPVLKQMMPDADWHWLRYPFLDEGDTAEKRAAVRAWLAAHGYRVAEVSMSFGDYAWNAPYARCAAKHDEAAIQKLHDTYLAAAKQNLEADREEAKAVFGREIPYVLLMHMGAFDARMLPELIAQMRSEGFTFTTLEKAQSDAAYKASPAEMSGGGTFQDQVGRVKGVPGVKHDHYDAELDAMCR